MGLDVPYRIAAKHLIRCLDFTLFYAREQRALIHLIELNDNTMTNDRLKLNDGSVTLAPAAGEHAPSRSTDMNLADTQPGRRFSRRQLIVAFILSNVLAWATVLWIFLR